jgi:hypothetical protein
MGSVEGSPGGTWDDMEGHMVAKGAGGKGVWDCCHASLSESDVRYLDHSLYTLVQADVPGIGLILAIMDFCCFFANGSCDHQN